MLALAANSQAGVIPTVVDVATAWGSPTWNVHALSPLAHPWGPSLTTTWGAHLSPWAGAHLDAWPSAPVAPWGVPALGLGHGHEGYVSNIFAI